VTTDPETFDMRDTTETGQDRTLYWTLSFYMPVTTVSDAGKPARNIEPDAPTLKLRDAIEPLFNDISDRSRRGHVEDYLYAGAPQEDLTFVMPEKVRWSTEGRTFRVDIPATHRRRTAGLRRFWYVHGNGSLSWNLSFAVHYGPDLARDLSEGTPSTYYFLSLLQKLAWPKEFRCDATRKTIDDLIGIKVAAEGGAEIAFWDFVAKCFATDAPLLRKLHPNQVSPSFDALIPQITSIEVPKLLCRDSRSLFFIRDSAFFSQIQPKDEHHKLVHRRERVADEDFSIYPNLVTKEVKKQKADEIVLGPDYWRTVMKDAAGLERLAYLFLSGFNQNIIDFTNQEASEVLDSLDPIYPHSDAQMEEGFFIRYANPRAMITYVSRSRTLEVGNDHIGTCPYAFLIHALSMHNEALARAQENATLTEIENIDALIREGEADPRKSAACFRSAEILINRVRLDAFKLYEKHRYINPFRYDTERDVFDEMERLRGTFRLKQAYESALASLEEHARDLARNRQQLAREREEHRDKLLSVLFGIFGISGVIQVFFQLDAFFFRAKDPLTLGDQALGAFYFLFPVLIGLVIFAAYWRQRD